MLTATHTHSAPFVRDRAFEDAIVEAIARAAAALQPARMAFGTGVSYINVNRNMVDPDDQALVGRPELRRRFRQDRGGDRLRDASTGEPIAIYYNYGVHAVVTGNLDLISADIPGATSNYIEESLGPEVVALWSTGAAGDQNPIYFQQTYDLRQIRIEDYARRGEDISNAMPPGGQGMDRNDPRVALLMDQQKRMILSMGQMLGEEVLHVARFGARAAGRARPKSPAARRRSAAPAASGPTRAGRAIPGTYVDADPVEIRLSLLKIGDTVIGGVDGEVFTAIAQRFKAEIALQAHDDGDADQRDGAIRLHPERRGVRLPDVRGARLAAQAGLRRKRDRERIAGPDRQAADGRELRQSVRRVEDMVTLVRIARRQCWPLLAVLGPAPALAQGAPPETMARWNAAEVIRALARRAAERRVRGSARAPRRDSQLHHQRGDARTARVPPGRSPTAAACCRFRAAPTASCRSPTRASTWPNAMTAKGYTVFVLVYRLPGEGWNRREDVPLQDAQRAVRLIRARSAKYGLDAEKLYAWEGAGRCLEGSGAVPGHVGDSVDQRREAAQGRVPRADD